MLSVPARAAIIGALFAAFVTLPGLGTGTLWDNSETAYGEVAREVLLTRDWVVMHLNLQPWFVQPPLYFWIAAAFAKVLGAGTLALRLPSALATIAMGGLAGYGTARIAGGRAGTIAALVLSTALMQAIVGRLAIMDALLDLAVTAAILWGFRALDPAGGVRRRDAACLGAAVALALGTLAKGPVAPVIVALVLGVWAIWEARAGRLAAPRARALILGAALFIAITLPWFVALTARVGVSGVAELIGHYTVGRYTGVIENQHGPIWYYIPVLILGFFPWIAFVPVAIAAAWRIARTPEGHFARLALVWTIVPFVFFSCASTKLPNYVALMLPALAIVVALWFDAIAEHGRRRGALVSAATIPAFVGLVAVAITLFARSNKLDAATEALTGQFAFLGIAMLVGGLATVAVLARRATAHTAPYVLAVTSGALVLFIALIAEPVAEPLKPIPPIASTINANATPADTIAIRGVSGGNGLTFYTRPPTKNITDDDQSFVSTICPGGTAWIVTRPIDVAHLTALAQSLQRTATLVEERPNGPHHKAALLKITGPDCPHD